MQTPIHLLYMYTIQELPSTLDDLLLPLTQDMAADMFVIGTQESTPARREWELLVQKTLGPFYVLVQSSAIGVIYMSFFMRRDLIWFCSGIIMSGGLSLSSKHQFLTLQPLLLPALPPDLSTSSRPRELLASPSPYLAPPSCSSPHTSQVCKVETIGGLF